MVKVVVAGSRDFDDYNYMCENLSFYTMNHDNIEIVSGGANGADKYGERWAKDNGYKVTRFIPDWSIGKQAGMIRNKEMAQYSDIAIVFWDGVSKGSKNMIEEASYYCSSVIVILYKRNKIYKIK